MPETLAQSLLASRMTLKHNEQVGAASIRSLPNLNKPDCFRK